MARTRTRSSGRLRAALFLGVGFAMTGLTLVAYGTHLFRGLELGTVDTRFSVRGTEHPSPDVTVVAIDSKTFSDFNTEQRRIRYPFPRHYFAKVIDRLHQDRAKVIAYDIQFTERTTDKEDLALLDSVAKAGNVVLATTEVDKNGHTNVFGGDEVVRSVHARVGNGNFPTDPGDVIRRVAYKVDRLKSLSLVAVERATGKTVTPAAFGHRTFNWIDFAGPTGTFRSYSFSDVFSKRFPPGTFRGKIVVVGPSAPSLQDLHPTSAGDGMSGAEVQANAIATAERAFPLTSLPDWFTVLSIAALGLLAPLASLRLKLLWTLVLAISAAALYVVATQVAFDHGHVVSFVYPFGALTLSSVGSLGAHYLLAAFERERVRDVFSRFVPESVVEQVLARTDEDLRLGGVTLTGTCMFTDLRGFTSFSEALPAPRVIEILNVYLSEMTEAILDHGGTLVAFMGDGIFAVYGAPIEQPDHADRALASSREMLTERLPRVNEWLQGQGIPEGFRMGIGLNSGTFMSGNVGSERRLEYAAIGDVTNTASRLEGMTKGQTHYLFMSDTTREALTNDIDDLVFVDEFEVRGRQRKVKIWSIEAASVESFEALRAQGDGAK